jgi:uncharacterized protein involved in type VI secretion and phage assembly
MKAPFYGKFRGTVTDIQDPNGIGRIKANVPDVTGSLDTGWALPSFPATGSSMGVLALPAIGTGVWIEFEHGDSEHPVWSGCWYDKASDVPQSALTSPDQKIIIQTTGGHSILIDDTAGSGGITLQTSGGQKIVLSSQGIEIDNGSGATIKLSNSQVSINSGALEVA